MEDTMMLLMDVLSGVRLNYSLMTKEHVMRLRVLASGLILVVSVLIGCHVFVRGYHRLLHGTSCILLKI